MNALAWLGKRLVWLILMRLCDLMLCIIHIYLIFILWLLTLWLLLYLFFFCVCIVVYFNDFFKTWFLCHNYFLTLNLVITFIFIHSIMFLNIGFLSLPKWNSELSTIWRIGSFENLTNWIIKCTWKLNFKLNFLPNFLWIFLEFLVVLDFYFKFFYDFFLWFFKVLANSADLVNLVDQIWRGYHTSMPPPAC